MRKLSDQQIAELLRPTIAGWSTSRIKAMGESLQQREIVTSQIIAALRGRSIELISYGSEAHGCRAGATDPDYLRAMVRPGARITARNAAERAVIDALCTLDEIDKALASFVRD